MHACVQASEHRPASLATSRCCAGCAGRLPLAVAQVVDPVRASYGVDNAMYAVGQLAQTTMRR